MSKVFLLLYLFSLYFIGTATGAFDTTLLSTMQQEEGKVGTGGGLSQTLTTSLPHHRALLSVTRRFASPLVVGITSIVKYIITNVGNV